MAYLIGVSGSQRIATGTGIVLGNTWSWRPSSARPGRLPWAGSGPSGQLPGQHSPAHSQVDGRQPSP